MTDLCELTMLLFTAVYHVLLHIQRKLPSGEFFRIIHDKPQACNLFEVYCRQQVRPDALRTLKDYYDHDDRRLDSANIFVLEAYTATSLNERLRGLRNAQNLFNDDREGGFAARATEEQIKLLQFQEEVQKETGETYLDLSIAQTVYKLLIKVRLAALYRGERGDWRRGAAHTSSYIGPVAAC